MINVCVMYPNTPGARFDHDYYRDKHLPLVQARVGPALKSYAIERGLAGGTPETPAAFLVMCHLRFDSVEAFQSSFGPHAVEIRSDIPNYTDLAPIIQISEVVI